MGRWSKSEKQWKTVVAMRRAAEAADKVAAARRAERRDASARPEER